MKSLARRREGAKTSHATFTSIDVSLNRRVALDIGAGIALDVVLFGLARIGVLGSPSAPSGQVFCQHCRLRAGLAKVVHASRPAGPWARPCWDGPCGVGESCGRPIDIGRIWLDFGRTWIVSAKFGQDAVEFWASPAESGQTMPQFCRISANIHHLWQIWGPNSAEFGRFRPRLTELWPNLGEFDRTFGRARQLRLSPPRIVPTSAKFGRA